MANRFPLIYNPSAGQIQELSENDNLDLNLSGLVRAVSIGATNINISGIATATTFSGNLSNTLTLNTSGTGLSGSTTFNNSGVSTFTVTSNATNENVSGTIVARDQSGNFSAGTITASLDGTATTATNFTVTANNSTNETTYPLFVDGATGSQGAETDTALSYNPSTNTLTAGTFNSTSDRKLKKNVRVVKNASELISKLEGVNFTWRETGEKSVGVIAQQVESYIPQLVSESQEVKSVNYNGLVGILIEAFKEQQKQIEELKEVIQNM